MVDFTGFLSSSDTLRVYKDASLIFSSDKDRLFPLLEYIDNHAAHYPSVVICDKVMGNAAALLSIVAPRREVMSPLGSQPAVETLSGYGIIHSITGIVECIMRADGKEICPMEALSIGKGPEEFYRLLKARVAARDCSRAN